MTRYAYHEKFPKHSRVRIAERAELERFRAEWKYHHPLMDEQLDYAGQLCTVRSVGFYHGGDVLYTLDEVPGIWHEVCLGAA